MSLEVTGEERIWWFPSPIVDTKIDDDGQLVGISPTGEDVAGTFLGRKGATS